MTQSSLGPDDIALRVLQIEGAGAATADAWAGAVDSACRKIAVQLEPLMSGGGAAALLGRAILLTRRDLPDLEPVELSSDPSFVLGGLRASLVRLDSPKTKAAGAEILANVIRLLIRLLGEDLGSRPIRKLWPNAFSTADSSAFQGG